MAGFQWATLGPGHGWVDTFRCMSERWSEYRQDICQKAQTKVIIINI